MSEHKAGQNDDDVVDELTTVVARPSPITAPTRVVASQQEPEPEPEVKPASRLRPRRNRASESLSTKPVPLPSSQQPAPEPEPEPTPEAVEPVEPPSLPDPYDSSNKPLESPLPEGVYNTSGKEEYVPSGRGMKPARKGLFAKRSADDTGSNKPAGVVEFVTSALRKEPKSNPEVYAPKQSSKPLELMRTPHDIDLMAKGSILHDQRGVYWTKAENGHWNSIGSLHDHPSSQIELPASVILRG